MVDNYPDRSTGGVLGSKWLSVLARRKTGGKKKKKKEREKRIDQADGVNFHFIMSPMRCTCYQSAQVQREAHGQNKAGLALCNQRMNSMKIK